MTALDRAVGVLADAHDNGFADSAPIWLRGNAGPPFTIGDLRELIIAGGGGCAANLAEALRRAKRLICKSLDHGARDMSDMLLAEALKGIDEVFAASGMEARRAETGTGSVHDSPTGEAGDAQP